MKTITAIIIAIILLAVSIGTGSVFAQDGDDDGYPVVTETTPEPTDSPTPTPEPTEPAPAPPQPTPEPTEAAPDPTAIVMPASIQEADGPDPVCEGVLIHPALTRVTEVYNISYEELLTYFCDYDFGVGEVVLMLETFNRASGAATLEEILTMRFEEELGWGEIWQRLGLIGAGQGEGEDSGQTEAFRNNNNRQKYNQGAGNAGVDALRQANNPDLPQGMDDKDTNKPVTPPGLEKKGGHPGNGKKP